MASALCNIPQNIAISQVGADGLHVSWDGASNIYKLAYKREEIANTWNTVSQAGPGSSGGSGLVTDDTGGLLFGGPSNPSADFTITGLTAGIYDLRLYNKCGDGSDFVIKRKALISIPAGIIPNFKLTNTKLSKYIFEFSWDTPTVDNGFSFVISWCELNTLGKAINCENAEVGNTVRSYQLNFPEGKVFRVFVSSKVNAFESAYSEALIIDTENMTCCALEPATVDDGGGGGDTAIITGVSNIVTDEVPVGAINGSNVTFVSEFDFVPESVEVAINGIGQEPVVDFHTTGTRNVVMHVAPLGVDSITIDYLKQP